MHQPMICSVEASIILALNEIEFIIVIKEPVISVSVFERSAAIFTAVDSQWSENLVMLCLSLFVLILVLYYLLLRYTIDFS